MKIYIKIYIAYQNNGPNTLTDDTQWGIEVAYKFIKVS